MDDLGTDEHGLKRHGWAARWEWLNLNKGYTEYRHGSLPQKNKLSRELAKQAVITKCRGLYNAEPSRVF